MNIKKYIDSKENINIYNLENNKEIITTYNLEKYPIFDNLEVINPNPFSEKELFIFIMEPNKLKKTFFNKIGGLNNTLLFITNNNDFKINATDYNKLLISYGYKYQKINGNNKIKVFIYDISEYKDNPDWLNSKNWANPDLWEK
tara:strand:+ start:95 stop:526 length:432 start_codon:yes stop_codon:yes gene_type:complete